MRSLSEKLCMTKANAANAARLLDGLHRYWSRRRQARLQRYNFVLNCKVHTGTLLKMPWTTGGTQHAACIGQYGRFRYQPTQNPLFALRVIHANLEAILDTG